VKIFILENENPLQKKFLARMICGPNNMTLFDGDGDTPNEALGSCILANRERFNFIIEKRGTVDEWAAIVADA